MKNTPHGTYRNHLTPASLLVVTSSTLLMTAQTGLAQPDAPEALQEIIVTAQTNDEQALDRKRYAINIRDLIDLEDIQDFPDQDISETLNRLPGLSIQQSPARGFRSQFITVRGVQPELNNVTILGQEIISTQGDRSVALDVLPSNSASLVEIYKTITPDLDANALGGTVNIIPMSAFQSDAPVFDLSFSVGDTEKFNAIEDGGQMPVDDLTPIDARVAATTLFGNDEQFGIAVSGNAFQQTLPVLLHQCDDWRFAAGEPPELPEDFQLCEGQRLESGLRSVERYSLNSTVEWQPDQDTRFYVSGLYSESEEFNVSTQTEWNFSDAGDFTDVEVLSPGVFFNGEGENEKEMDVDREDEEFYFIATGTEHQTDRLFLTASTSYSRGESFEDIREWSFNSINFGSTVDFNEEVVYGQPADPQAFFDPDSFIFDEIDIEPTETVTDTFQAQANARYTIDLGNNEAFIQTGLKWRTTDADNDREENQFEATPGGIFDGATLGDLDWFIPSGRTVFGRPLGPVSNPVTSEQLVAANPGALTFNAAASLDDSGESDFSVSEDVAAAYVLGEIRFGDWGIIGGARVEQTRTISTAKVFNDVTETLTTDTRSNEYTEVLPSFIVRWEPLENTVVRASWTQTIARPVLPQLAGFTEVDFENSDVIAPNVVADGSVSRGNPDLEPYKSDNFDLSFEWYPSDNAIFAVAAFYKDISDPIFGGSTNLRNTEVGGVFFENVSVGQPQNAGEASILGFEAQVDYSLPLEGPLGGLGLLANYADFDAELTDVPGRPGEELRLLQQPDRIATVAPYYSRGGFSARLVYSYTGDQLFNVNDGLPGATVNNLGTGEFDRFQEERFTLGFHASYTYEDRYEIFVSGENLTEEPFETFQGVPGNLEGTIEEPSTLWLGLRVKF